MNKQAYDTLLTAVVEEAHESDASGVAALEPSAVGLLDQHLPDDDHAMIAASMGIIAAADSDPQDTWQRRVDDIQNCSPTEYATAIAADVLISDGLAAM